MYRKSMFQARSASQYFHYRHKIASDGSQIVNYCWESCNGDAAAMLYSGLVSPQNIDKKSLDPVGSCSPEDPKMMKLTHPRLVDEWCG